MPGSDVDFDTAAKVLDEAVTEAVEFFLQSDPDLFDGYQTAADVLSHLVFWHRQYVVIIRAIRKGQDPELRVGTFAELNAGASREFASVPTDELVCRLQSHHEDLVEELQQLPDFSLEFAVKRGGRSKSVRDRIPRLAAHIHNHVRRLRSAERHGEDWVKAYYQEI